MRFLNSVKSLYAAVGILILTLGLGVYVDYENEAMHIRNLEVNSSLGRMVRLNQDLTNMLMIAVLKQNALGTASYGTINADLKQTMATVIEITRAQGFTQEIISLRSSQDQLREKENMAVQMIALDKWDAASDILFGDDYMLSKKTYEVDSEAAVGAALAELSATAQRFGRIKDAALALRVGALVLLVWIGVMFSRRSRADLAEQKRLRDEITVAYGDMEARVLARTADLETSTQRLAAENEERVRSDNRTRLLLGSVGEGIFGVDAQGRGTFINAAGAQLLGISAEEILGQDIASLIHHSRADGSPLAPQDCPMHVRHALSGQPRTARAEVLWRKDGTHFFSEYSVTPFMDEKGQPSGAVVVFRDITEQLNNQQELQERMDELQRFNRLTMGREDRMIALKQEVNGLLQAQGLDKKYRSAGEETS